MQLHTGTEAEALNVREYLKDNILIFDGAMGTMLQKSGLEAGGLPEIYNIEHPDIVRGIHEKYVKAGADAVTANTFQANALKLKGSGYTPGELITAGVRLAKESGAKFVALDIGPLGQLMSPMGTLNFETAYELFKQQIAAGVKAGADILLFETMSDLLEDKAGVIAAREYCDLPVFVSMTYQKDGRTFVGVDPAAAAVTLTGLRADAFGINCSLGPAELKPVVKDILEYAGVPVLIQPNAGLPGIENGKPVYDVQPDEYAEIMAGFAENGAAVLGGCCGTSPEYTAALANRLTDRKRRIIQRKKVSAVCSARRCVLFGGGVTTIGEGLNPAVNNKIKESLCICDFDYIVGEAIDQSMGGADVLKVNCGLTEIDETQLLPRAVEEIQAAVSVPLLIESPDVKALEQAVRIYNGKPIINFVNGKKESLNAVLQIAAKYGAAVLVTIDGNGTSSTEAELCAAVEKIVSEAEKYGIPREDILIDCLPQKKADETLRAVKTAESRLGVTMLNCKN